MEILHGLDGLTSLPPGAVLSIGNFDGVHRGHARILGRAAELARQHSAPALAIATFEPHPLTVLRPELAPPRLATAPRKVALLSEAGVTHLVILPPDPGVLNLEAEAFWVILRDQVKPSWLVEGGTFNFGKNRAGTIDKLRRWAAESPVRLDVVPAVETALTDFTVVAISSSVIRWLLQYGRVRDAAICLGRAYEIEGEVIRGHERGRAIGVPTANLSCHDQLIPADGVYAGRGTLDGKTYPAAVSIGVMPTFGQNRRQVEAHLVGFAGDLYGRTLRVELVDWLREQRKFAGVESLKAQLARDIESAARRHDRDPARPLASVETQAVGA
jgi:riboflavin kinase/FMN adenylyltransferase